MIMMSLQQKLEAHEKKFQTYIIKEKTTQKNGFNVRRLI